MTRTSRRTPNTLRTTLDALVLAGLLSTTAGAIENRLDLVLVSARVIERVSKVKTLQKGVRSTILIGGLCLQAYLSDKVLQTSSTRTPRNGCIPVLLSAH